MCLRISYKKKIIKLKEKFCILEVTEEKRSIRIRTKMSRIFSSRLMGRKVVFKE
jgi:hypothetical protein